MNSTFGDDEIEFGVHNALSDAAADLDTRIIPPGQPFKPTPRRGPIYAGAAIILAGLVGYGLADRNSAGPNTGSVVVAEAPEGSNNQDLKPVDPPPFDSNLSGSLRIDTEPALREALERPEVGDTYTDPAFGSVIRRLTDAGAGGTLAPLAAATSAWNSDESYLLLYRSDSSGTAHQLHDGATGQYLSDLEIAPSDIEQVFWSRTNPNIINYFVSNTLMSFNVESAVASPVRTFADCDSVDSGRAPVGPSNNDTVWGLLCHRVDGVSYLSYNTATDQLSQAPALDGTRLAPIPTPDGDKLLIENPEGGVAVTTVDFTPLGDLDGAEDGNLEFVEDSSGTTLALGPTFDQDVAGSAIAYDLETSASPRSIVGEATGHGYPPSGTWLVSGGPSQPHLAVIATRGNARDGDMTLVNGEVLLVDMSTSPSTVIRLAHHRSESSDYFSSPFISISPSGSQIVFSSDWAASGQVDTYLIEIGKAP